MAVFAGAAAYLVTTVPSPDPQETTLVIAGLLAVASAGALIVISVIAARVVLGTAELRLRCLRGSQVIQRSDILGIRHHTPRAGLRRLEVVSRTSGVKPLVIAGVLGEDDAFRLWFDSLPRLAEDEAPAPRLGIQAARAKLSVPP
jgi:hypothetical protein